MTEVYAKCNVEGCSDKCYAKGLCRKCYMLRYRQDNKEHIIKVVRQYHKDNKKHNTKVKKQWREDNPKYNKQYYQGNKEHFKEHKRQYNQTPAGKAVAKASNHNYRALIKGLTKATVQQVYEDNIKKYGTLTCVLCGKPVEFKDSSLEHLTPVSRGGSNNYDNLGVAHLKCNRIKQAMTLSEWLIKIKG